MKKLLALLLVLVMALSCVACAGEEAPVQAPAEEKNNAPAEEAPFESPILSRPENADEALAWAQEQTWGKTYTIGFGSLNDSDPVAKVMGDRFVEWCGYYGINVVRTDNKSEGTTAVTNVQLMLNQGVDAIMLWPLEGDQLRNAAQTIVDGDDFLAANAALSKEQKKATYKPLHIYGNENEALMAYNEGVIGPHCPILVRVTREIEGVKYTRLVPSMKEITRDFVPEEWK